MFNKKMRKKRLNLCDGDEWMSESRSRVLCCRRPCHYHVTVALLPGNSLFVHLAALKAVAVSDSAPSLVNSSTTKRLHSRLKRWCVGGAAPHLFAPAPPSAYQCISRCTQRRKKNSSGAGIHLNELTPRNQIFSPSRSSADSHDISVTNILMVERLFQRRYFTRSIQEGRGRFDQYIHFFLHFFGSHCDSGGGVRRRLQL